MLNHKIFGEEIAYQRMKASDYLLCVLQGGDIHNIKPTILIFLSVQFCVIILYDRNCCSTVAVNESVLTWISGKNGK